MCLQSSISLAKKKKCIPKSEISICTCIPAGMLYSKKEARRLRAGFFSNKRQQSTFPFGAAEGARTMQCKQVISVPRTG